MRQGTLPPEAAPGVQHPQPGAPKPEIVLELGADGVFSDPNSAKHVAAPSTAEDGDTAPKAPETTKANSKDVEARYTDAQLLGRSFRVRRAVYEAGTQRVKIWQGMRAKVRNALDTPAKAAKKFAYEQARKGHARKEARMNAAASERVRQKRQPAVAAARGRMEDREKAFNTHTKRMQDRTKTAAEVLSDRRKEHQERIDDLKGRKQSALASKAVRKQLRVEGATRREAKEIMAELPQNRLERVGRLAILAETSARKLSEAERAGDRASKRLDRTEHKIEKTEGRIANHNARARTANESIKELETTRLPEAKERLEELRGRLAGMEAGNPDAETVGDELWEAQRSVDMITADLTYWHNVAASSIRRAARAEGRHDNLLGKRYERAEAVEGAIELTGGRRKKDSHRKKVLGVAVTVALRPKK